MIISSCLQVTMTCFVYDIRDLYPVTEIETFPSVVSKERLPRCVKKTNLGRSQTVKGDLTSSVSPRLNLA